MPTPVGHALAGLAVWAVSDRSRPLKDLFSVKYLGWAALCVVASTIPDADFIIITKSGLIKLSGQSHHGVSHSIGIAVSLGALVWAWAKIRKSEFAARASTLTTSCYTIHIIMDLLNVDTNPANGIGLPALWPLMNTYFYVPIFPGANRVDILSVYNVVSVGLEVLVYGSILFVALMWSRRSGKAF